MNHRRHRLPAQEKLEDEKAAQESLKHGLPNWRHPEQYNVNWNNLDADHQRWEFLRRNKEYRKDWESCEQKKPIEHRIMKLANPKLRGPTPAKTMTLQTIATKYGISHAMSPALSWEKRHDHFKFIRPQTLATGRIVYPLDKGQEAPTPPTWDDAKVWIEFDLNLLLDKQLKAARDNLDVALAKAAKIAQVKNFMQRNLAEDDLYADDSASDEVHRKLRNANRRPKNADEYKLNDQSYLISLLRICDGHICDCTFKTISDKLLEIEDGITENAVQKRYKFAQKYWTRL